MKEEEEEKKKKEEDGKGTLRLSTNSEVNRKWPR